MPSMPATVASSESTPALGMSATYTSVAVPAAGLPDKSYRMLTAAPGLPSPTDCANDAVSLPGWAAATLGLGGGAGAAFSDFESEPHAASNSRPAIGTQSSNRRDKRFIESC